MRLLAAIATGAAALCLPALAGAATVAHDPAGGPVVYSAAAGEGNVLTIGADATALALNDVVGIGVPDPPAPNDCGVTAPTSATCPLAPLTANLGDGDDVLVDPSFTAGTTFNGQDGIDRVDYSARADGVSVSLGIAADDGGAGEGDNIVADDVAGGAGNDSILGTGAANGLAGGPGDDSLTGGGGVDGLDGGSGNDNVSGGSGGDLVDGGTGADTVSGGAGDDTISADDGVADTIDCGPGLDTIVADRGAGGITDRLTACENVSGPTAPDRGNGDPRPGSSLPGIVTVRAPGVANPADLTPPSASLRVAIRQKIKTVSARGVAIRVACDEACGISAALALARPAAQRLGLAPQTGGAVLGTAKAKRATEGVVQLRVKLSRKARQRLRRAKRVTLTAQALVSDATGNGTLLQRRVTLVP